MAEQTVAATRVRGLANALNALANVSQEAGGRLMTRRNVNPEPNLLVRAAYRQDWPPACPAGCGFVGEPNDTQTPWVYCGDGADEARQARHQRQPVRATS